MDTIYYSTINFVIGLYLSLEGVVSGNYLVYFTFSIFFLLLSIFRKNKYLMVCIFSISFLFLGLSSGARFNSDNIEVLNSFFYKQIILQGEIEPLSFRENKEYVSFILRCQKITLTNKSFCYDGRIRINLKGNKADLSNVNKIIIKGNLEPLNSFRNPGGMNGKLYNRINKFGGRLKNCQILEIQKSKNILNYIYGFNEKLTNKLIIVLGPKVGNLLSGMILGGNGKLDDNIKNLFVLNGLAHLLSVSGTHLILLTNFFKIILKSFGEKWQKIIIIIVLCLYALLCGLKASVLRALIMCTIILLGKSDVQRGKLLCITALILLLLKPVWLYDIGFQLSFGATAGIIYLVPVCKKIFMDKIPDFLNTTISVTIAAQLGILPLIIGYFHQVSLISIISNILFVPILEITACLSLICCLFPSMDFLLVISGFFVEQILIQAELLSKVPFSNIVIGCLPVWTVIVYYFILGMWADLGWFKLFTEKQRKIILVSLSISLLISINYQKFFTQPLTAYFLDVGQGDSTVIITPEHRVIVCDTGGLKNISISFKVLIPFLHSLGYDKIDILFLSHLDYDHVGGAADLLQNIKVENLILPFEKITENNESVYKKIIKSMSNNTKLQIAHQGQSWNFKDTKLTILDVPKIKVSGNEASTLIAVENLYGSILLTGDLGIEREKELNLQHKFTVLKVGHHGSKNSSSSEFLAQVKPLISTISCGKNNRYGHPHIETIQRLQNIKSKILRTDEYGCLKIIFTDQGPQCYVFDDYYWERLPYFS